MWPQASLPSRERYVPQAEMVFPAPEMPGNRDVPTLPLVDALAEEKVWLRMADAAAKRTAAVC